MEENEIKEYHKPILCNIYYPEELTFEDCKTLIGLDFKGLLEISSEICTNIAELQIQAFKLGFKWIKESDYFVFIYKEKRAIKLSMIGNWIQINPSLSEEGKIRAEMLLNSIELNMAVFSGNNKLGDLKELKGVI